MVPVGLTETGFSDARTSLMPIVDAAEIVRLIVAFQERIISWPEWYSSHGNSLHVQLHCRGPSPGRRHPGIAGGARGMGWPAIVKPQGTVVDGLPDIRTTRPTCRSGRIRRGC